MDNHLREHYYSPSNPASFSGLNKLSKVAKTPEPHVKKWLEGEDAYTLHKQVRKIFPRNKYLVTNIDELFQADLIDLRNLKEDNDNVGYLLSVIDVFSKYAWVKPLQTKTGVEVSSAFQQIFNERIPLNLQTDKGKEFLASRVQKLFKQHEVNFYVAKNPDVKAAVVERFNKTLKSKMFKYFTYANTQRYIDVLPDLVQSYNNSYHRTIKMAPNHVNADNVLQVYRNIYRHKQPLLKSNSKILYKVGDYIRITRFKHVFEKGYASNWSGEIFQITNVIKRDPVVYKIKDLLGEPVDGVFYQPEIQRVQYNPEKSFHIDKILKKRYKNGRTEILVQWKNYPPKFNSWILESSLHEI